MLSTKPNSPASLPTRLLATLFVVLAALTSILRAQGYPPDEAARHMTVPEGLEVQLVASEPLVRQPVAMEFDDRGRLWVIQYLQYPNPAGLERKQVDRYSRTVYDKVPEPPPHGPRGADRITILSDSDGDGVADRGHDFVDGLNLATGLAFGHGGVYVLQVPYLLFYADRDRDDAPDGDPEVLLTGFGMEDAHSVANSLTWGPDGWLYGCQGSTVTSNIRGIEFQQGVWRYHPASKRFELFCEGGGNAWGLDFDAAGELFYSTNYGGYAMLHGVQGAYYWKQFGKHGALHNPHAYGYFDHVPHAGLKGGHVTVGGLIYQGDLLGERFGGKYIGADLLGHAMYWHKLTPRGSTFAAQHEGDLLVSGDTHFAPSDVTVGPDGAIYVCDWHDARTAHPDPDADWDRTNGRIFRIARKDAEPFRASGIGGELVSRSSQELVETLADRNPWYVRKARRLLANRRDAEVVPQLVERAMNDDAGALEGLWALYVSGGFSDRVADDLLSHGNPDVRRWTVRLLGDENRVAPFLAMRLAEATRYEETASVRAQLAATAKRLPAGQALPIIEALLLHDVDADDPFVPLLVWWAVEQHCEKSRSRIVRVFSEPDVWERRLARETVLPRLVRRYAAEASSAGYKACVTLLQATPDEHQRAMLIALDQGLKDRLTTSGGNAGTLFADQAAANKTETSPSGSLDIPESLAKHIDQAWHADSTDIALLRLAIRTGRDGAQAQALELAADEKAPQPARVDALELLAETGNASAVEPLLALFESTEESSLRGAALAALSRFDDERIAATLLETLDALADDLRTQALDVLLGRKASARALLRQVDDGKLLPKDIAIDQLRVVALHEDPALDELVKKHWGAVGRGTPEERLAEMRRLNNDLRAASGDPAAGKALFAKHCGTCHRLFGEGNEIGPELTHANRKNTAELLATIVDPSAVIRREYMNFLVTTSDGRVLTGLLVEQTPSRITLLGAKNERTTVPRDQVDEIREAPTSLMPENLLKQLQPQELRDLFGYLQSDPAAEAKK